MAAYYLTHRGALLACEVTVGLALLAFIPFVAALVPVIWRAGQETLAVAGGIGGGVFVAMGFVSTAAETALIGVADGNQPAAVLALNQLRGRTPVVWTITALVAAISLPVRRTGLVRSTMTHTTPARPRFRFRGGRRSARRSPRTGPGRAR